MRAFDIRVGIVVASLTLATAPAFAQRPSESGGGGAVAGAADRSSGSGAASRGGAVDRGGGGGSVASSGGSVSSSSGDVSSGSPSASAVSSPSVNSGVRSVRGPAPQHRAGYSSGMAYSAGLGGQKAAPRSSGSSSVGGAGAARTRGDVSKPRCGVAT